MTSNTILNLKSKLRLFVIITIIAVITLSTWEIYTGRSEIIELAERQSADYARALAEHTDSAFAEADGVLREVIHDISLKNKFEQTDPLILYQDLKRQHENPQQVGALFLVDKKGVMFINTQEYPPRKILVADRDYFKIYLDNPDIGFTIGKPVMSRLVNRWRFNLMRPINQPGKPFNGLIAAGFEVDYFKRFFTQASLGPRGRILLVREDGVPLVVQPYTDNAYESDFRTTKLFKGIKSNKPYGTYHTSSSVLDKANRIISYNQLTRFPVVAIVSLNEEDILQPWIHKASIQSSLTFALCILIVTLTRIMFRHLDKLQTLQTELDDRSKLLAASVNEQRIILNNVSVGIGFVKNDKVQWSNVCHDKMFGYEAGQARGMSTNSFYSEEAVCPNFGTGGRVYSTEVTLKKIDGTLFPCILVIQAIDSEKPEDGSIWVIQDISDFKRSESERMNLLEQVQHARNLENIGTLAGGVAHDFNNLLMVIQGSADLAKMRLELFSPVQQYLVKITQATQKAAELCQKMLAYSGKGFYHFEKIHVQALLDPVLPQIKDLLSQTHIDLKLSIPDELPLIKADARQLRQAVINVINNAVEAIGDHNGSILVSGYCETTAGGKLVVLEVVDTGCGMDEVTVQRVFDPFFSTKFTGRGLNMSAVSGVVKALKGTISIKSQLGKGTTVQFAIPAYSDHKMAAFIDNDRPAWLPLAGKPTVIFVDIEHSIREMTASLLETLGYAVITAESVTEALLLYKEFVNQVDILFIDVTLWEMNGTELLNELRLKWAKVPVLLTSEYTLENVSSIIGKEDPTVFFIQKPYTIESLNSALIEVLSAG